MNNDITDEEIQKEMDRIRNMTDEEREKEILKIRDEYDKFKNLTIPKVLQMFEDEEYHIETCCQGLTIMLKALIKNFGTKEMLEACIHDLTEDMEDIPSLSVQE